MISPRTLLLMLFGALIAAAFTATPAHADPVAPQFINWAEPAYTGGTTI